MMNQETEIEKACASVATAMALLIAAVRLPPLAEVDDRNSVLPELPDNPGIDTTSFCTPADRRIFVYCAGSAGLAALARDHGPKIMSKLGLKTSYITKCGTTALELSTRLRQIGQDQYGAAVRTRTGSKPKTASRPGLPTPSRPLDNRETGPLK